MTESPGPSRLRPYVPRLVVDWLGSTPAERYRAVDASMALVDVSGFTRLTERLSRLGRLGAEELSDLLDDAFAALLAEAYDEGAGLVKWGGDALLLVFDGDEHPARACRAAHRMRALLRRRGPMGSGAGRVNVRTSAAVHTGRFDMVLVGHPAHHRELLVCGPATSELVRLAGQVTPGQIGVSGATAQALPAPCVRAPGPVTLLRSLPPGQPVGVIPARDVRGLDLAAVLPKEIVQHALAGEVEAEHRSVAVGFVRVAGTDRMLASEGAPALAAALDDVVGAVQRAAAAHAVTFFETDVDDDACRVMLTAGAPRSVGDDGERLLRALCEVVAQPRALPLQVGVAEGRVFAGTFGPPFRRSYSVKGDAVNLAARLCTRAQAGEILASRALMEHVQSAFETEAVEPFLAKGKARPVEADRIVRALPRASVAARGASDPIIGRDGELSQLHALLERAQQGHGGVVDVIGPAGIGKTRLVEELRGVAAAVDVRWIRCDGYESATPYHAYRPLLRDVLDDADVGDLAGAFAPLLGAVLDVPIAETPESAALAPDFRRARTIDLTTRVLAGLMPGPTLLVVDDAHLMDDASSDLTAGLGAAASSLPWLVVVVRRDEDRGHRPEGSDVTQLTLGGLPDGAARRLASGPADRPLAPHVVDDLVARAGGNPAHLRALVEHVVVHGPDAELPDSVEAAITRQLDLLDPGDRALLRHAAVLGARFGVADLADVQESADAAALARLAPFVEPVGPGAYAFRSELAREVAYEGLPFRVRRALHARSAAAIERRGDDDLHAERLAAHHFEAGAYDRAWHYARIAGHRACEKYAYADGAAMLRRALASARRHPVDASDVADAAELLGDASRRLGDLSGAKRAYRVARQASPEDLRRRVELMRKEAMVDHDADRVVPSMRALSRAMRALDGVVGPWVAAQRAELEADYAGCRFEQGRFAEAIRWARSAERHAAGTKEERPLAQAYEVLQMAHALSRRAQDRPYGELALAIYERLGDRSAQAKALNNLAVLAWMEGRGREAEAMFERAAAAFTAAGDTLHAAMAAYNRGDVLLRQNRLAEARVVLEEVAPVLRALRNDTFWAPTIRALGLVALRSGQLRHARQLLTIARETLERLGFASEVLETDLAIVELLLSEDLPVEAATLARRAASDAEKLDVVYLLPALLRLHAAAARALGDPAEARLLLEQALRYCEDEASSEAGFILLDLAELLDAPGSATDLRAAAAQVLDQLGYDPGSASREVTGPR